MKSIKNKKNLIGGIIVVVISSLIVFVAYRIWELDLNVVPLPEYDGWLGMIILQSMKEDGIIGAYFVSRLGAPGISSLVDTPFLSLAELFEYGLLNIITSSAAEMYHLFYFLTFPLVGLSMYILTSRYTDNIYIRSFISILFVITPYHFERGYLHGNLSNYYIIPVILFLSLLISEEDYSKGCLPDRYKANSIKKLFYIGALVLIGFSNIYYAFFALICIIISIFNKILKLKKPSVLIREGSSIIIILVSIVIGLLPNILYPIIFGANSSGVTRQPGECEYYALKIIQLILPCRYNNIDALRRITEYYNENTYILNENSYSSLGLIASIGFLIACFLVLFKLAKVSDNNMLTDKKADARITFLSLIILVMVMYGVAGGFGAIVGFYMVSVFRSINRVSIVIACASLIILCILLDYLNKKLEKKGKSVLYSIMLIGLLFSVFSEVPFQENGYRADVEAYEKQLKDFYSEVEAVAGENALIYNAPYHPFPEGGMLNYMASYDQATGYIYSKSLKWSACGVKGRNDFEKYSYIDAGASQEFVDLIKGYGFTGLCIDRFGFEDLGEEILSFYINDLNLTPIESADGRLYYFDIR